MTPARWEWPNRDHGISIAARARLAATADRMPYSEVYPDRQFSAQFGPRSRARARQQRWVLRQSAKIVIDNKGPLIVHRRGLRQYASP